MKFIATSTLAIFCIWFLSCCHCSHAFSTQKLMSKTTTPSASRDRGKGILFMSDEPLQSQQIGAAERLLLERKRIQDEGLVQELGRTIKKDGWDGVRALIWSLYGVSNVVFPVLAVVMFTGICVNLVGYGYYWDETTNKMVFDTLEHIRQENIYQQELLKIAARSGVMFD